MSASSAAPDMKTVDPAATLDAERYRCGTLQYTKASLFILFSWLIWGNLCFNLFESAGGPGILGLYLQDNFHVSNLQVNILFNVIPMIIGTFMTPIISFKSDRTRSRFGRRIPYMLFTAPFLVVFAAAIGFSDDIVTYCKIAFTEDSFVSPFTAALIVIGFLTIGFSFFNEFVGTVYYYLCPDVVPRHFIGRFQGISGMVGFAAGIAINKYIVPHQLTHLKLVHVGIALLYFVGFGLMCWRVKEGQYPPVTDVTEKTKFGDQVKLYFRECFTHPIFILFYISTAATVLTKGLNPAGIFGLHLSQHQAKVVAHVDATEPLAATPGGKNTHASPVQTASTSMAMTPDGNWLVSGGKDGVVKFWENTDGKEPKLLKTFQTQGGAALAVAVTADGKTAVSGSLDGLIEVWDTASGQRLQRLMGHTGSVRGVALSRDGSRLASASADKTVKLWDVHGGTCIHTLAGHDAEANCIAFSSDGGRLVSGGSDKKIILWDARQGTLLKTLEGSPGPVYTVCFAPAIGPVPAQELPPRSTVMAIADSWRSFLGEAFTNESLYDTPVGQTSKLLGEDRWVLSGGRDGAKDIDNSRIRIWDLTEGNLVKALKGHKQAISSVIYKPDLRVILSGSPDGSIRLWKPLEISELADDQSFKTFSGYTHGVTALAVSQAGVKMVNASANGTLHVWDIDQGISLAKLGIRGILFSIISMVLSYPIGVLVDRWNPMRVVIWTSLLVLPFPIFFFIWYHNYTFALWMDLIRTPFTTLVGMASMPMAIMLYPRTKYGQMSSANALVRQFVAAVAGPLGAILMDYLTVRSMDTDYFRYGFLFQFIAGSLSLLALLGVYYHWKKLGGTHYVAPEA